ncbi:MAG TPA: GNAT family N-acetyltransferase [Ignavibacteriaceae bacterium]|jgi:lipid II:glycine glycyltransferase (peptidoglycan interpeptide bridge formation enzyme)
MTEVFKSSNGFEVFPRFAVNDNGQIVAAAFPVLVKIRDSIFQRFTNRLILYSTPLFKNNAEGIQGLKLILDELKSIAKKRSLFMEIRNSENFIIEEVESVLKKFEYIPYQNYLVHLNEGKEKIWDGLNSYTRNHIRKAEKKGIEIREAREEELEELVSMIESLYHDKHVPLLNRSVFFSAYKKLHSQKMIRVIVAEYETKLVGVRMSLNYNKTVFDWYAAAKSEFNKFYINEALSWNTINWGIENNFEIFDFGGGAVRGQYYGPAKFKEKFRGELVEFGRHRYTSNPLIYKFALKLYARRTGT